MSWSEERSRERIAGYVTDAEGTEVKAMTREMDLENLSEKVCREIDGAHLYAELAGMASLVNSVETETDRKRLIQAMHVFQREVGRIVETVGAVRIHFQSSRVHALAYLPIDDQPEHAKRVTLAQLILDRFEGVFNAAYPELPSVRIRSGSDRGVAIATRNGTRGDRELLFIGSAANQSAKLLPTGGPRRMTKRVRDLLPDRLRDLTEPDDGAYALSRPSDEEFRAILEDYQIDWSTDASATRVEQDKKAFPLSDIDLAGARVRIDFDDLSIRHSKFVLSATVFGDVSGFTKFVEDARTPEAKVDALKAFHVIRRETAQVVTRDYEAVRVQYQGDRVQALVHLPEGDEEAIAKIAVEMSAGLQSSFETTLKEALPAISRLGLAGGVGLGETVATKLGARGHRDRICLGEAVVRAERNEENIGKRDIGIDRPTYDALDEDLRSKFSWNSSAGCYVASGLTIEVLESEKLAKAMRAGSVYVAPGVTGSQVLPDPREGARLVRPAHSWGPRS